MLLGQEGEAFFLREAYEDEASGSIENVSASLRYPPQLDSANGSNNGGAKDEEQKMVQKGPKSGQDAAEYRQNGPNIHLLEDLDIDQDMKKGA